MNETRLPLVRSFSDPRLFGLSLKDPNANLVCRYFSPKYHPRQWAQYLDAAEASYGKYGVASAVRRQQLELEPCASFWMIEDRLSGALLGGMRNHGPYKTVDSVWALQEMASHPDIQELEAAVAPLLPKCVVENKGVFVDLGTPQWRARQVADMLLRLQLVSIDMLKAHAMVGTSAQHTLAMWQRAGCVVICPHISVAYPNDNYQTFLVVHYRHLREQQLDSGIGRAAQRDLAQVRDSLISLEAV